MFEQTFDNLDNVLRQEADAHGTILIAALDDWEGLIGSYEHAQYFPIWVFGCYEVRPLVVLWSL